MAHFQQHKVWPEIEAEGKNLAAQHLRELFAADIGREAAFSLRAGSLFLDFSRERLNARAFQLLTRLAEESGLAEARQKMFEGAVINTSEKRAVLHTALRRTDSASVSVDGKNVMDEVKAARQRLLAFAEELRAGRSGIKHIVHVGIGGSDLGPRLLADALADGKGPQLHFVGNVDSAPLQKIMRALKPEETLVMLASKSFTTAEVLQNGKTLLVWLEKSLGAKAKEHLLAATAVPAAAQAFGVKEAHIFPLWDWVGGRFSVWSSVSLSAAAAMGAKGFEEFLAGGEAMDKHFQTAVLDKNMPVLLALIALWNMNVMGFAARAVLPYAESLGLLPMYLQQLEMESLGKSVDRDGKKIDGLTAPLVFGATGTPAQHAFMQALHQGPVIVPAEMIVIAKDSGPAEHRHLLQAHALAQAEALAFGKSEDEVRKAEPDAKLAAQKMFPGNRPSSVIVLNELSPRALGELVALYEHKVFVQAHLLNLNAFDQWGVELGKKLSGPLLAALSGGPAPARAPLLLKELGGK